MPRPTPRKTSGGVRKSSGATASTRWCTKWRRAPRNGSTSSTPRSRPGSTRPWRGRSRPFARAPGTRSPRRWRNCSRPTPPRARRCTRRSAAREPSAPAIKSAGDFQDAFVAVAEHVKPSVVFIRSQHVERADDNQRLPPGFQDFFPNLRRRPQVEQGSGSGFIVSADGYILTNNHVVAGADKVTVRLYDKREFTAKVVGTDPNTDVAVIKIDARGLPGVAFGNSDSARVGEWVLAIGNPLGEAFAFTVTAGIVSAKGRLLAGLAQTRYA